MILIDALYINNSGGKILLDYLVNRLMPYDNVFFLFDDRCVESYKHVPGSRKLYLKASLHKRDRFYRRKGVEFKRVLCFGNLAPTRHLKGDVYTYFHQPLFLNIPKTFNFKDRLQFRLKAFLFGQLLQNTDKVLVQSPNMARLCECKFNYSVGKTVVLPFYPDEDLHDEGNHTAGNYIYVSGGSPHKNHIRLIEAFCSAYDISQFGQLTLTIALGSSPCLEALIQKKRDAGYPIRNIGFVDRKTLVKEYNDSEYLIFPSLEESFGLGLVEAIECGCKVIGADRPYTYQVCTPSLTFDPLREEDITSAILRSHRENLQKTEQIIHNDIQRLLNLLLE